MDAESIGTQFYSKYAATKPLNGLDSLENTDTSEVIKKSDTPSQIKKSEDTEDNLVNLQGREFKFEAETQIEITLSDQDRSRLESLERTLQFVQSIPEKLSQQRAEFNMRYLESLKDRLRIYQNLGIVADPREFETIIKEALSIARDALSQAGDSLGPQFDEVKLAERFVEGERDGNQAIVSFNSLQPVSDQTEQL